MRGGLRLTPVRGLLLATVVLAGIALWVSSGNLLKGSTLSTLTPLLAVAVLLAAGQGLVIGTGGIDLSTPYVMTLVGTTMVYVGANDGSKVPQAVLVSLAACALIGLANGVLVEAFGLNPLVATLSVGLIVAGLTRLYRGPVDRHTSVPDLLQSGARLNAAGFSALLLVAVVMVAVLTFVTFRTVAGRRLVASSAAPRTAYLIGIRARTFRVAAYTAAAVLYGIGAVSLSGLLGSPDLTFGNSFQLPPIVAVVLAGAALTGGRVNFPAIALGAVFVTLLDYVLRVAGYSTGVSLFAQGCVLAGGLSAIHLFRRRSAVRSAGVRAGSTAPRGPGTPQT
ncbi:ABC transporter permease [Kineococcus aurantiacus]|uniref:Autoinducer 2 import system permease protein LsrD n=1 Tax=Kineococcus aurantiacus TaxID=37633 RepID=A0A7Y9J3L5_9ACTN|nr:ABC transporter permease [Kineococcus aurantiacus]NYD25118.1 ribose transport system permease protein [Kineococcus aurantiacus]